MIFLTGIDHYHDKAMMPTKPPAWVVQDLRLRLMKSVHILDLDRALVSQASFLDQRQTEWTSALDWGPHLRLACSFSYFKEFEAWLRDRSASGDPAVTLYGSGDFHHVTLALIRRIAQPFNLLVLDKHPDWMCGVPFLHCGTWLRHALRMPTLKRVFHCGGELDFDNAYRWLAPWPDLASGRIVVFPAARRFQRGRWAGLRVHPLQGQRGSVAEVLAEALSSCSESLRQCPLYVSIDKDVLRSEDAAVNWDSGLLPLSDAVTILEAFLSASGGRLLGADLLGDWSPIRLSHWLNRLCDRVDHPSPNHDPLEAAKRNGKANATLLRALDVN
jgi:hypothetical protein